MAAWIVFRREVAQYLTSPFAYLIAAAVLLLTGVLFNRDLVVSMQVKPADPSLVPLVMSFTMIFFAPLLTMRLFAEERREGTLELLLTAPVSDGSIVFGKFLGAWFYYSVLLLLTFSYQFILVSITQPDLGHAVSAYIGIWLYGGATLAVGVMFSALTENQIVAAFLSMITLMLFWLGDEAGDLIANIDVARIVRGLSLQGHFSTSFATGLLKAEDVAFFAGVITVALFITIRIVEFESVALMRLNRIVITRQHVGIIASVLGGASLMIGLIGLIWQGGVTFYVGAALVIGIVGLALWYMMSPKEFIGFVTGRQARQSTTAIFSTLVLIGITVLVYLLLQRAALTLDMTVAQRFSLSPETEEVLHRVTQPMRITGFYTSRSLQAREIDDEFFRLYETDSNGLITRQYIDPDQQPALAQRYGFSNDGDDFISYVNADGTTDLNSLQIIPHASAGDNQERDVTQAISRLLIAGTLTVYLDTGLGERDSLDTTQQGISDINNGMRASGLVTYPINIVDLAKQNQDIPANAAAVLFVRPTTDLTDPEIAVIDRYLKKGGSLFLMPDVLFNANPFMQQNGTFNKYLYNNYGIGALDAAVVDPSASGQTPLDVISAYVFTGTDISQRLDPKSNPTIFDLARPLEVNLNNTPPNIADGQVILSSQQSYGETDLKTLGETNTYHYDAGKDLPGPLTTVAWSSNKQTQAKIVLVGDSDFVTNAQVLSGGNGVLFTDSMSWLTGLGSQISFQPKLYGVGTPLILVSAQTLDLIAFLTVILLPGVLLVAGIAVWMRRTRRTQ